ncbi:MAG: glycosyl hydrolase family 18 protein, partial [Actinomycetota bacterium]
MSTIAAPRRTHRVRILALGLAAMLAMSSCQPNRFISGWIPYWGGTKSRAAITDAGATGLFSEASLFWYGARSDGTVTLNGTQGNLTTTVNALRSQGLPVIPTVVDGTAPGTMSSILANRVQRTNHISQLIALVTSNGYDGIDLDYEVFAYNKSQIAIWSTIKPNWITFESELAAELHVRGKMLSVTVPPVWNSGASGYTVYA